MFLKATRIMCLNYWSTIKSFIRKNKFMTIVVIMWLTSVAVNAKCPAVECTCPAVTECLSTEEKADNKQKLFDCLKVPNSLFDTKQDAEADKKKHLGRANIYCCH